MSFARLVERIKRGLAAPAEEASKGHDPLRLAMAVVLLEVAYADGSFTPAQDGDVVSFLRNAFALDPDDARELIEEADEIRRRAIDHFAFTNFIRKNTSLTDRVQIVKTMWRLVYGDGKLTDYEGYLVRKIADLLGLEHHVMIEAKVAVLQELGPA